MTQTTTPDNIPSPDLTDQYALTQDMANLAQGTQTALTRRANAYKGAASARLAFSSAQAGTLWQDTDGAKLIWRRDGSVWVPAVWRWGGSVAQMNSFSQAPNGFKWVDTASSVEYIRKSGSWKKLDSGWITIPLTAGTGTLRLRCMNDDVEIDWAGGGSFPNGATALSAGGAVPAEYRPSHNTRGTGVLNGNPSAALYVNDAGTIGIINGTGATRTGGEGTVRYYLG